MGGRWSSLGPGAHSLSWHRRWQQLQVGWDVWINIHLPMHMENAHSCPACFMFIRTNCFRSPFTDSGQGGLPCQQLCGAASCLGHPTI